MRGNLNSFLPTTCIIKPFFQLLSIWVTNNYEFPEQPKLSTPKYSTCMIETTWNLQCFHVFCKANSWGIYTIHITSMTLSWKHKFNLRELITLVSEWKRSSHFSPWMQRNCKTDSACRLCWSISKTKVTNEFRFSD